MFQVPTWLVYLVVAVSGAVLIFLVALAVLIRSQVIGFIRSWWKR